MRGRDGIIQEAVTKYCSSSEQKLSLTKGSANDSTYQRYTEQAVRKLIRTKQKQRDMDSKWTKTKGPQLRAEEQIQASSVSDMDES